MAQTLAELGYGTVLKFETVAGSGVFVEIEEMKDFPEFGDEHSLVEVTHQTSPDKRKEFIAGLAEGTELNTEHNYIKSATQEAVRAAKGTTRNFQAVYSTTPALTMTFPAVIMSAKVAAPVNEAKKLMLHLKVTGDITES